MILCTCSCGSDDAGSLMFREPLSPSMDRRRDRSWTSMSESSRNSSSSAPGSAGVSLSHRGFLIRHPATLVRYVRQCSGHE
uniref:Sps1 n=1 Tax=Arundo donax TaxID=35708 RepID=A0A0A9DLJ4_ARUDO